MFVNIDYNKRQQKAKFHLAKPNKQIISHISEKFRDKLSLKLGNINELDFSIPHTVIDDSTGEMISNHHIELIKEKMLIRVTLDTYKEWYVIDSIDEDGSDSEIFNVKAFSLGQELTGKRVSGLEVGSTNATELLTLLLESSVWKIGEIDEIFDIMYRSFDSGDDTNILDCIIQAGETFGALIEWDTENRKVSFKDMSKNGKYRGMSVDYGKFLNSIKRTRTTDEMVTRLYVYGSEDLSINTVTPTGMPYIEDFSYFMYPFERDVNKNVIKSSFFMSDELCNAILDHQDKALENAPEIKVLLDHLAEQQVLFITEESELTELKNQLETILELLDTAKAVLAVATLPQDIANAQNVVNQRVAERDQKESEIMAQQLIVDGIQNEINETNFQISTLQNESQVGFTQELIDELNLYVIEKEWRDDRYINVSELYEDAIKKFEEIRKPKVVIEASIDSLLNVIEEQYYWDKIVLGDLIKVKYKPMNIEYMSKIIEINYDLENGEVDLVIANTKDLLSETDKLVQLLYSNSSASTLIQNNQYKWNKINAVEEQVFSLLTNEWDATKNKIIAGVNNSVEVGNRGVIIRNPDFPQEVVIMQSGVVALSKDGGETWKTAIKPDGVVAERLIGQIIAGQNLLITNSAGTFKFDTNGVEIDASAFIVKSSSGGENLVNRWNDSSGFVVEFLTDGIITPYEKKMTKLEYEKIIERYNANVVKITNYYADTNLQYINDYHARKQELHDYLFVQLHGDMPMLAEGNMEFSTTVDKNTFESRFKNYTSAEVELDKQLAIRAMFIADSAQHSADDAQDRIDEVMDDIVYKVELHSSNGSVFKNGIIDTVVTARVWRGKEEITSILPASSFYWKKKDKDGNLDTTWNSTHQGVGNTITITGIDVQDKATFECDIDIVD